MRLKGVLLLTLLAGMGCGRGPRDQPSDTTATDPIDRSRPPAEALALFRQPLPEVIALTGGAASREQLIGEFVRALEHRDTTMLRNLILTKAEFAWLYYPTAREANPPYSLSPDLMWFTHEGRSEQGIKVALEERGGRPLGYVRHHCAEPRLEGENRLWGFCMLTRVGPGQDTTEEQLFGLIVERGGVFKFVSYANQLE
jgi:hypothetical protein